MHFHDISLVPTQPRKCDKCSYVHPARKNKNIQKHVDMAQNDFGPPIGNKPSLKQIVRPSKVVLGGRSFPCEAKKLIFQGALVTSRKIEPPKTHLNFTFICDPPIHWRWTWTRFMFSDKSQSWCKKSVKHPHPWTNLSQHHWAIKLPDLDVEYQLVTNDPPRFQKKMSFRRSEIEYIPNVYICDHM